MQVKCSGINARALAEAPNLSPEIGDCSTSWWRDENEQRQTGLC